MGVSAHEQKKLKAQPALVVVQQLPRLPSGNLSAPTGESGIKPGRRTFDFKIGTYAATCLASGIVGSDQGLLGLVSVYCE